MAKKPNLSVTLIDGTFENDVDQQKSKGKMDPFVALTLGTQKYETKVAVNQGKTPKWNETFNFIYDESNYKIEFLAYDKENKNQKSLLGSSICNLQELQQKSDWSIELDMINNQVKQGVIRVNFDFIGKQPPPPRPPSEPKVQQPSQQVQKKPTQQGQKPEENKNSDNQSKQSQQSKLNSGNNISSKPSSYKSINNPSEEKQPLKKLEPLPPLKLEFKSVAYEDQANDLQSRIDLIQEKNQFHSISSMFSQIQQALTEGLDQLRLQRPDDQVQFLGEFLSNYNE